MKLQMITLDNKAGGDIELDAAVFGLAARRDILQRAVEWQRAKKQAGTHKTKTISEISGTTKKPFKQKGTGSARQGSLRSAQMRGGATIFGPVVRSHAYSLPKKVRKLALKIALSSKLAEGKLSILSEAKLSGAKTKTVSDALGKLGYGSALIIDGNTLDSAFALAVRNVKGVNLLPQIGANVYDILRHQHLVLTKDAVKELEARLK